MTLKQDDHKDEFQEIENALQDEFEELMDGSGSEDGLVVFCTDQEGEMVDMVFSDGERGSIPIAKFKEVIGRIGKRCLVCSGTLGLIFDPESKPVLCLACDKCEAIYQVVLGELCLSNQ